ncbi:MAG: hypothetical protein WD038_12705 [Balneolales bacterium]
MINPKYYKATASIIGSMVFIIAVSTVFAQNTKPAETPDFLTIIETTNDSIKLKCKKGCAWKELIFSAEVNDDYQAVNQYGMTIHQRNDIKINSDLANFVFLIKKTKKGISLQGKQGSAWKSLSFSCPSGACNQAVDQNGMTILASN